MTRRLYTFVVLVAVLAVVSLMLLPLLMLLLRAGDERVPQTRIENDVPVLIDGVPHRCDFTVVAETSGPDTARATCEENTP